MLHFAGTVRATRLQYPRISEHRDKMGIFIAVVVLMSQIIVIVVTATSVAQLALQPALQAAAQSIR